MRNANRTHRATGIPCLGCSGRRIMRHANRVAKTQTPLVSIQPVVAAYFSRLAASKADFSPERSLAVIRCAVVLSMCVKCLTESSLLG